MMHLYTPRKHTPAAPWYQTTTVLNIHSLKAPEVFLFLNWMPSNDTQDDGDPEGPQDAAEAAAAASSQGI
jgi:hypothetical protein